MGTRSTSKKLLQSFHVRKGLFELFSARSQEMDCSVDYLVNEAMRLYASTHGFLEAQEAPAPQQPAKEQPPTIRERPQAGGLPRPGGVSAPRSAPASASIPRPTTRGKRGSASAPKPVPKPSRPPAPHRPQPAPAAAAPAAAAPAAATPAPVTGAGPVTGTGAQRPNLMLIFQGRKIPILQDQFIIGRGSKSSDLAIKDANISRKHAAVIFHNGTFYMKDLGSTNGIEYMGKPVDSKRIDEGDVFSICGYDMHFTYSA
jgi:predicted component of type VI protein secretion system